MLTALTKAVNAEQLPEFSAEDVERFGQRAAYQAQLRLPWTNARSRENDLQALENRIGKNRLYNEARGGLPVCTTCTSNGNNTVTGHTADSAHCPFHEHRDPFQQHSRSAAEMISMQALVDAELFRS